jgi:hypothetical protein
VWDVSVNHHIEPKKPISYVNHYSFHILDAEKAYSVRDGPEARICDEAPGVLVVSNC